MPVTSQVLTGIRDDYGSYESEIIRAYDHVRRVNQAQYDTEASNNRPSPVQSIAREHNDNFYPYLAAAIVKQALGEHRPNYDFNVFLNELRNDRNFFENFSGRVRRTAKTLGTQGFASVAFHSQCTDSITLLDLVINRLNTHGPLIIDLSTEFEANNYPGLQNVSATSVLGRFGIICSASRARRELTIFLPATRNIIANGTLQQTRDMSPSRYQLGFRVRTESVDALARRASNTAWSNKPFLYMYEGGRIDVPRSHPTDAFEQAAPLQGLSRFFQF